ncbi:cyanophycin synthetase [Amphibiibacter pelophylacis]|uniref:Cyanophycin synthetase n=1 Tax=Amphibiibacter pelophylacis TaxID=1799477 RepID=A0ACC6NZM4_9BURK
MELSRIRALRGPNLWSRHTAIQVIVTVSPEDDARAATEEFLQRVRASFPDVPVMVHAWPQRTSLARVLEKITLGLQAQAGCAVSFSRTAPTAEVGVSQVIVQYTEEAVGRRALELAHRLLASALADQPFDVAAAVAELAELDEDVRLGPSTGAIVQAALARGIPVRRMNEGSLVQLGWGARARRIQAAETDTTSAIAEAIAQDKELTKSLLLAAGVPVPLGEPVADAASGWVAAQRLGLPVVLKPRDGNQGKGVTVNISDQAGFDAAWASASRYGEVLLERYLPGHDFRLLVVGDRLVAAARREPPMVTGDGQRTVRELVELVNLDPRRGQGHGTSLTRIPLDEIALRHLDGLGLTPDSVPLRGQRVVLRSNANLSTGGTATDVTAEVHPAVAASAVAAARMVGVDICGVDVVCQDIQRPLQEQSGGIVEVNAAPGLRMHLSPSYGSPRPVGDAVIDHMFGPAGTGQDGRIPVVAVTGTNGKTTTSRLIAHLFALGGHRVGLTNTDGVYVNGRQTDSGDCSGPRSARNVLAHPDVDVAVFETARGGLLREGLAFDRCRVGVVTNLGAGDHLGLNYITTVDELAVLKRVIVLNIEPTGWAVLNAADPGVAAMAGYCPSPVIFFAPSAREPVLAAHLAQGRRGVYVEDGDLVAREGTERWRWPLAQVPLTRGGRIGFQVENALAALASAWALDLPWEQIGRGLATFTSDAAAVPGRFNFFDHRGATVIADYGHNPDAIAALVQAVENLPAQRRLVLISGAGDRRDDDLREQTRLLGAAFDEVMIYEDACQRGRAEGEVVGLLREGLAGALRTRQISTHVGEMAAIDTALSRLQPGDLALILIDQVQEALAHLQQRVAPARQPS